MLPTAVRLAQIAGRVSPGRVAATRPFADSPTMRVAKNLAGWSVASFVYGLWPLFVGDFEYWRFPVSQSHSQLFFF